jgi:dTDP-glucose 4,6-dehydratase
MKLLVTGGAGFIGANYIHYLLQAGSTEIICLDSLTYAGNLDTLAEPLTNPHFTFIRADITDRAAVEALLQQTKPDAVVNFAAESHVDRSISDPSGFLHTNTLGTQVLLDACRMHDIARFHQVSTDEVYGDLPLERRDLLFTEASPLKPSSPYAASKAAADLMVLAYYRTYGLPVTISRCSNNYGPYQFPEKLIPLMVTNALSGKKLPVYGDGLNVRDWLHVRDHCRAVDLVLRQGQPGEVYNVGGRSEVANIDVVKEITQIVGGEIEYVIDRAGHDRRYAIDATKLETELGWSPEFSFSQGLAETVRWYLEHQAWWQEILSGAYLNRNAAMLSFR